MSSAFCLYTFLLQSFFCWVSLSAFPSPLFSDSDSFFFFCASLKAFLSESVTRKGKGEESLYTFGSNRNVSSNILSSRPRGLPGGSGIWSCVGLYTPPKGLSTDTLPPVKRDKIRSNLRSRLERVSTLAGILSIELNLTDSSSPGDLPCPVSIGRVFSDR